jgi:hypothetical protein
MIFYYSLLYFCISCAGTALANFFWESSSLPYEDWGLTFFPSSVQPTEDYWLDDIDDSANQFLPPLEPFGEFDGHPQ